MNRYITVCMLSLVAAVTLSGCDQKIQKSKDETIFGLAMGDHLSSLVKAEAIKQDPFANFALVNFVFHPKYPNSAFSQYAAFVTEKNGVCQIKAQTPGALNGQPPSVSAYDVAAVKNTLIQKYGKPDQDLAGDYVWEKKAKDNLRLPNSINRISFQFDIATGEIELLYNFANFSECVKENQSSGL